MMTAGLDRRTLETRVTLSGRRGLIRQSRPLRAAMEITLDTPAGYLHWGFILISIPNLLLIGLMIVLFALALFIPLPGEKEKA
jgi:hypothetical protein